ncbi:sigma-54 interaction domain-containing protein [Anaeromyxobacter oryzae]|uniref:Sigma-54 factor interaction domain-containing protein n=1 Tax=Anaeromyxobacter oryzae TaxID=2918170 RepID=A0ABM7X1H2_9BACT|nr:sigma-54 dependent transcriptional regulator [Anaeromyxobacter oryzae]BDG05595.1 hypothetical protein AMOR_45910 [Anaeromyxobacter oryzae]
MYVTSRTDGGAARERAGGTGGGPVLRLEPARAAAWRAPDGSLVARSLAMRRLLDAADRVAPRDITILVHGETGSGKELVAARVHARSQRASAPLVVFNCAAIPAELAESELFGHARGAFTGATDARRGFFAQADGGTLVLDEVGELPAPLQAKLLRVLQSGEIQPVGAGRIERIDVRVVACTNRDLAAEVRAGRFREDLYYRLAVIELRVPPLRERREDIPALVADLASRYAKRFGAGEVSLSPEVVEALREAEWPGNVRELENAVARMVALGGGPEIGLDALGRGAPALGREPAVPPLRQPRVSLREQVEALERSVIARTLAAAGGNRTRAARRLGVSRGTLAERVKRYGLEAATTDPEP